METIVIYKSKYGSTEAYAKWISEELGCVAVDAAKIKAEELLKYDSIVYGGGLYAEVISGLSLITKNLPSLSNKKIAVFTTGITPIDCRDYYDKLVLEKNFKTGLPDNIKVFNFPGKMIINELSLPHKTAIKRLKNIMSKKENPSDMEKLLISLCDQSGDFSDKNVIYPLIDYMKNK